MNALTIALAALRFRLDYDTAGYLRVAGEMPPAERMRRDARRHLRAVVTARFFPARRNWEWPYWALRQYDPADPGYRTTTFRQPVYNTTRRDWTAIGLPGRAYRAVVDPRGLITPWPAGAGWSLDTWVEVDGQLHTPARAAEARQALGDDVPAVLTEWDAGPLHVTQEALAVPHEEDEWAYLTVTLANPSEREQRGRLLLALRPYNPEGVAYAWRLEYRGLAWYVNGRLALVAPPPAAVGMSDAAHGDVAARLAAGKELGSEEYAYDGTGLASGVAAYPLSLAPGQSQTWRAGMPLTFSRVLEPEPLPLQWHVKFRADARSTWTTYLSDSLTIRVPDARVQAAFDANKTYLLLMWTGPGVVPGPFTPPRWAFGPREIRFREAAYITSALDHMGLHLEAQHALDAAVRLQARDGSFSHQPDEQDATGQAVWALWKHFQLTGDETFGRRVVRAAMRGGDWILKRLDTGERPPEAEGLLPGGPSAEFLGPEDYFYWDDLWACAALQATDELARALGSRWDRYGKAFARCRAALDAAWEADARRLGRPAIPASPFRGLDSAMAGSLAALYPLRLLEPFDARLAETLAALGEVGLSEGTFFDYGGSLAFATYLAMHVAQAHVLRRSNAGWPIVEWLLRHATPTWTWPAGIHPLTRAGAAGDGHSGWACADWLNLVRDLLLFEEGSRLVLTPALPREWLSPGAVISAQAAPTAFGRVTFELSVEERRAALSVTGKWRRAPDEIELNLPVEGATAEGVRVEPGLAGTTRLVMPGTTGELAISW